MGSENNKKTQEDDTGVNVVYVGADQMPEKIGVRC